MRYTVHINTNLDIMTIKFVNNYEYNLHYSTNYSDYKPPSCNLIKKTSLVDGTIVEIVKANPILLEQWKLGNFIQTEGFKYERLSQYEYDKYCYEEGIQNANARLYEFTVNHLRDLGIEEIIKKIEC